MIRVNYTDHKTSGSLFFKTREDLNKWLSRFDLNAYSQIKQVKNVTHVKNTKRQFKATIAFDR
jgi:hypothetical protein